VHVRHFPRANYIPGGLSLSSPFLFGFLSLLRGRMGPTPVYVRKWCKPVGPVAPRLAGGGGNVVCTLGVTAAYTETDSVMFLNTSTLLFLPPSHSSLKVSAVCDLTLTG
jgi:hypothetical protein